MMLKFGRLIDDEYFICDIHTLHLGVVDALYGKEKEISNDSSSEESSDDEESGDKESDDEESDYWESDDDESDDNESDDDESNEFGLLDIKETIKRMRKIILHFKRSAVQNEMLQKQAKKDLGKELKLLLDVRTRWGSLFDAASRFLKMVVPIQKTLNHKDISKKLVWEESDTEKLSVS